MIGEKGDQDFSRFMTLLKSREIPSDKKVRVMVLSTELDDPRILGVIESQGAVVVADDFCTGSRYIWHDVDLLGDPLEAIAKRYLLGVNCPLKHPLARSFTLVEELINEFEVEKAMFLWPQACDPMGWGVPFIKKMLSDKEIPFCWVNLKGDGSDDDLSIVEKAAGELIGG
jgi:benzoyl-CoA reductase/2-hydroxyglutaryl-CoA dehydratase subunit BcrC/BadD/HgdB